MAAVKLTSMKLSAEERKKLVWIGKELARETGASQPVGMTEVVRRLVNAEYAARMARGKNGKSGE